MKNIVTITGIRPDFIRMSEIFKKLDRRFNHTLIHTGQHYNALLSDVFFNELHIRKPDFNWAVGSDSHEHIEQFGLLVKSIQQHKAILKAADLVLLLGDSNSVLASVILKKMGIKVGHIEAGMRSGDDRMLEEINRKVCDHCSDILFCYHENYKQNLKRENIDNQKIHVVGNTITEVIKAHIPQRAKALSHILVDIHRPENFLYPNRINNIIKYAAFFGRRFGLPVKMLAFGRTVRYLTEFNVNTEGIQLVDLMGFIEYVNSAYDAALVFSDSGTAQEELAFLKTPVIVPRDFTERWESVENACSVMLDVNSFTEYDGLNTIGMLDTLRFDTKWLGEGNTSELICNKIGDIQWK